MPDGHSGDWKVIYCPSGVNTPVGINWDLVISEQIMLKPRC